MRAAQSTVRLSMELSGKKKKEEGKMLVDLTAALGAGREERCSCPEGDGADGSPGWVAAPGLQ